MSALVPRPGQLVTSRAGRDKGRPFFVLRVVDERYAEVADGDLRSVERPKRKNVRHLQPHTVVHPGLAAMLERGEFPSDEALRHMLAEALGTAPSIGGASQAGGS
ncbi:MAG TPA: KOW domain-containing RNA-binding protein [Bacillota bacterium]